MAGFYHGESVFDVVLVTFVLGAGAAWLSGRAIAHGWRPLWPVGVAALLLGAAARFIHFALFGGVLLSAASYAADTLVFLITATIAWRVTRVKQMVQQYPWLYRRANPFVWREIEQETRP